MSPGEGPLASDGEIDEALRRLAREVAAAGDGIGPLRLVGVRSRGVPIAGRLAALIEAETGTPVPVGAIDITLYRDDLGQAERWPVLRGTEIDFEVDGAEILLVDDVLFTGRTTRAALNVVCDLGRPARVRLLVLVDRGHRELPIQPDFVGRTIATEREDRVDVRVRPLDESDEIRILRAPGSAQA